MNIINKIWSVLYKDLPVHVKFYISFFWILLFIAISFTSVYIHTNNSAKNNKILDYSNLALSKSQKLFSLTSLAINEDLSVSSPAKQNLNHELIEINTIYNNLKYGGIIFNSDNSQTYIKAIKDEKTLVKLNEVEKIFNEQKKLFSVIVKETTFLNELNIKPYTILDSTSTSQNLNVITLMNPIVKSAIKEINSYAIENSLITNNEQLCEMIKQYNTANENIFLSLFILINIIALIIILFNFFILQIFIVSPINKIAKASVEIAKGDLKTKLSHKINDNLGLIVSSIKSLIENLKNASEFTIKIGQGNYDANLEVIKDGNIDEKDNLNVALMNMRDKLKSVAEEEKRRNWATSGFAIFGEILRQDNDNIEKLSYNIIKNLVKFMDINQAGMFLLNESEDNKFLEMTACHAYDRKKFSDRKVNIGEGFIGTCFIEKETIYVTDVPTDYINITSGLGDAPPRSILIVPMKLNDVVYGILELASFTSFEKYQIEFVEKVGESVASTISTVKINIQTSKLLTKSQQQTEILLQQEEEMRQNLEELHSTQDEILKRESEITGIVNAIDNTIAKAELQLNGVIINVNAKFNKVFEVEKTNLTNHNIKKFIDDNQFDIFDESFEIVSSGESSDFTIKGHTAKNTKKWLLCSVTPVFDSNKQIAKVLFMAIDVTQQKELESELAQKDELQKQEIEKLIHENNQKLEEIIATQEESTKRETELSAIINGINESLGSYEFDEKGIVLNVNRMFLDITGLKENEIIGQSIIDFMPVEKQKLMYDLLPKLFKGDKHSGPHQFIFKGVEKWCFETYTPVKSSNGNFNKILVLANEITQVVMQDRKMKTQSDELMAQQEELRQNMEEMQTLQEDTLKRMEEAENLKNQLAEKDKLQSIEIEKLTNENNQKLQELIKIQEKILKDAEEQRTKDELIVKQAKEEAQIQILNMEEDFFMKQKELKKKLKAATLELEATKNN
ncbi:MAG: hypothetical protein A2033_03010 [Bacteroidetes bacterium GWA2_31_9]|nr:MAG: hypothetical protein A2033_03010 [Bacteroidetes bacterium GWA2_31_9]